MDGDLKTDDPSTHHSPELLTQLRDALAPRYDVIERIGQGGMAVVFRAREPRHDRDVAIKVIRPEFQMSIAADRFLREIQLTAKLQHPNIVSLFDSGMAGELVYYVMPFIGGESLRALLERESRLSIESTLQLTRDLVSALDYAHSQGIVHRDIKPENVLLSSGHAMLSDFGIAAVLKRVVDRTSLTSEGVAIGTPEYMSPEQCSGREKIDGRSDIYSLGCVLYEMLVGEPPFTGRTVQAIMARHAGERVPSIRLVRPDLPPGLIAVTSKALAKVPGDRYQTAGDLARALQHVGERTWRVHPWVAAAGAGAAALALYFGFRPDADRLDPNKVAIFPLSERGLAESEQGAGAAAAVMISVALEHADPLRPLDVTDRLVVRPGEETSLDTRRAIARAVGAAHYLAGIVQAHGDSITVGLRLHDVAGDSLIGQRSASGHRRHTPLHTLGITAVRALLPSLVDPGRSIELAPLSERRPSAVALFIQGEREYRRSRFPAALALYQRALADDSALVIAAIKGAQAAYWQDHQVSAELAGYAVKRDTLLPPRYAAFARGFQAFSLGQADSAEAWLSKAIQSAPGWPEALTQLGDVYFHLVPLRPSLDSLAEASYRAAVTSDSGFSPPLLPLSEIAIRHGRLAEARGFIDRLEKMGSVPLLMSRLRMMQQCVTEGTKRFSWSEAVASEPRAALAAARRLAAAGLQLPCAEHGFRAVLSTGPDELKFGAAFGLQSVLAAQGRTAELVSLVDSITKAGALQVLMTSYIVNAAAGVPVQQQAGAVAAFGQSRWGPQYAGLAATRRLEWLQWLYGVWHARRGDREIVTAIRKSLLDTQARDPHPITQLYADALGAHLRLLSSDTTGAIQELRRLNAVVPSDSLVWSMSLPLAVERLRLAELLLARGDHVGALAVASVFDHHQPMIYVAYLPASLSIRSRAAQALDRREAAEGYRSRLEKMTQAKHMGRSR